jgi:hypothetical protein
MTLAAGIVEEEKTSVRQSAVLIISNSEDKKSVGIVFAVVDLIT